jgi:quinone-modifying oxidoreductase subunit QmoA
MNPSAKPILVIGGGIAGMTAAVEAAEVGCKVILVEKEAFLGGRVLRMHRYFPKMCPPACGYEINVRRIRQNPRIEVHTLATVTEITGEEGDFRARIRIRPRYVTGEYALDSSQAKPLASERPDEFNLGMSTTKALYLPHPFAYPRSFVIDREALSDADAAKLTEICPEGSLDLEMEEREIKVSVGSVIVATGWKPYDATKLTNLGYGRFDNVVTNVMMERLAAVDGPTGGEITRPSDGQPAKNVAFVQCAGSRDENHLPYCSAVCCMGSLKQVRYVREKYADSRATMFYIDIRTLGRLEKFYYDLLEDQGFHSVKGKVAKIDEDPGTKDLVLTVEDTISGNTLHEKFDLVVLATGIVPNGIDASLPAGPGFDEYGFLQGVTSLPGVYAAGCAKRPCDVSSSTRDSTAAAIKAIQSLSAGD